MLYENVSYFNGFTQNLLALIYAIIWFKFTNLYFLWFFCAETVTFIAELILEVTHICTESYPIKIFSIYVLNKMFSTLLPSFQVPK